MDAETTRVEVIGKGDRLTLRIDDGAEEVVMRGEPGALLAFAQNVRAVTEAAS